MIIGDGRRAVIWFGWVVRIPDGDEAADAQVFFEFDEQGMITTVTDFWPEPYDPPTRPAGLIERW